MWYSPFPSHQYQAVSGGESCAGSSEKLLESGDSPSQTTQTGPRKPIVVTLDKGKIVCGLLLWVLITIGLGYFIAALQHPPHLAGVELRPYEWAPAKKYIEREEQTFTGTAVFEGNVSYREFAPGIKQYVGDGEEIDNNWKELIKSRYFWIPEEEAKAHWPKDYQRYYHTPELGWRIGLDVFHTLHCVNQLRMAINKARRGGYNETTFEGYHVDHCLDLVMQSIRCSGDLTPIPLRRFNDPEFPSFIDSNQRHVCRNVWNLRKYLEERKEANIKQMEKLEEEYPEGYDPEDHAQGVIGFPERDTAAYRPPSFEKIAAGAT